MTEHFRTFLHKHILAMGFAPDVSDAVSRDLVEAFDEPKSIEAQPYLVMHFGSRLAIRAGAMNSERIRHASGIAVILDLPALKRRYDEGDW